MAAVIAFFFALVAWRVWMNDSDPRLEFEAKKAELIGKGEKLDRADFPPISIEPGQNGLPFLTSIAIQLQFTSSQLGAVGMYNHLQNSLIPPGEALATTLLPIMPSKDWGRGTDNIWTAIEESVATNREALFLMREALHFPIFLPNQNLTNQFSDLVLVKKLISVSRNQILYDLSQGNKDAAMQQLSEASSLVARFQTHRSLIASLVKTAMVDILSVALWESLQHSAWSDEQLAKLQEQWQKMDLIGAAGPNAEIERVYLLERLEQLRADPEQFWQAFSGKPPRPGELVSEAWSELFSSPGKAWSDLTDAAAIANWENRTAFEDATWFLDTIQIVIQAFRARDYSPSLWAHVHRLADSNPDDAKIRRTFLFSRMFTPGLMKAWKKFGTIESW